GDGGSRGRTGPPPLAPAHRAPLRRARRTGPAAILAGGLSEAALHLPATGRRRATPRRRALHRAALPLASARPPRGAILLPAAALAAKRFWSPTDGMIPHPKPQLSLTLPRFRQSDCSQCAAEFLATCRRAANPACQPTG